jgi:hypothetical protein
MIVEKKVWKPKRFFDNHYRTAIEVVSKPQIRFKGKAQADRESAAYMGM